MVTSTIKSKDYSGLLLGFAILFTFLSLSITFYRNFQLDKQNVAMENRNKEIIQLKDKVLYLDEVLTMSAMMAAQTGDKGWEKRYRQHMVQLEDAMIKMKELIPSAAMKKYLAYTDSAIARLLLMENNVFDLARENQLEKAQSVFSDEKYAAQKKIYTAGMDLLYADINATIQKGQDDFDSSHFKKLAAMELVLFLLMIGWYFVYRFQKKSKKQLLKAIQLINESKREKENIITALTDTNNQLAATQDTVSELNETLEQKIIERTQELQLSKNQFQNLIENIPGLYWIVDLQTYKGLYISPSYETLWGRICESYYKDSADFLQSIHPDDREEVRALYKKMEKLNHIEIAFRIMKPDGEIRWYNSKINVALDANDYRIAYGYSEDITERKKSEEATIKSEVKFRTLFDTTNDAVLLLDENGLVDCNSRTLKMFEMASKEEFLDKKMSDLMPRFQPDGSDSETLVNHHLKTAFENGTDNFEWLSLRVNSQQTFPAEVLLSRITLDNKMTLQVTVCDISNRKKAAHLLEISKMQFQNLIENISGIYWIIDMVSYHGIYISPNYENLWGRKREDFYQNFGDFVLAVHPDDRENLITKYKNLKIADHVEITFRIIKPDGEIRWYRSELNILPVKNLLYGYSEDITDRKKYEDALVRSNALFQKLFHFNPASIAISGLEDGKIIDINNSFIQLYGFSSKKEVIGKSGVELSIFADPEQRNEIAERIKENHLIRDFEIKGLTQKGDILWLSTSVILLEVAGVPCLLSVSIDITERKKTEESLEKSEVKFRTLFNSTTDAVMLLGENGFVDCNPKTLEMFEIASKEEFCTKHPAELSPQLQPDGIDSFSLANLQIAKALENGSNRFDWEHVRMQTGETFPCEVLISRMAIEGKPILQATVRDITERKKAQDQLRNQFFTLENRTIQLNDFCYIISHNLRSPLVNIGLLVDYTAESTDKGEQKDLLKQAKKAVKTINETFNELVDSIQIKSDLEIKSDKIKLSDCIKKVLETLKLEINSAEAEIDVNIEESPVIHFPSKYLKSIIFNLISNAIKYKSPDRKPVIQIKTEKINNKILLSVSDNGLGIDLNKHQNNLFKLRKVFHDHPDAKGFGLFMTKNQVESMDGKIWAESTPDRGSTFFVEFVNQDN